MRPYNAQNFPAKAKMQALEADEHSLLYYFWLLAPMKSSAWAACAARGVS